MLGVNNNPQWEIGTKTTKIYVKRYIKVFFFFFFFYRQYYKLFSKNNLLLSFINSLTLISCVFFFTLILPYICHVFFSSMSCFCIVGQLFVPPVSFFLNVMMNEDFWGFLFYPDQLSIIKCECAKQVTIDLSGRFRRCP